MLDREIISRVAGKYKSSCPAYRDVCNTFTYIAKDKNSNVIKIGKSRNLRERMISIRYTHYYGRLDYELIAFSPLNIEEDVIDAILRSGIPTKYGLPKAGTSRSREIFELNKEDLDFLIDAFCFQRVEGGRIPKECRMTKEGKNEALMFYYDVIEWEDMPKKNPSSQTKKTDD